jgi:hypothetical protein
MMSGSGPEFTVVAANNGLTISAAPPTPWYKNPCVTKAIAKGALSTGIDAIGLIPGGGAVSEGVSLFHGGWPTFTFFVKVGTISVGRSQLFLMCANQSARCIKDENSDDDGMNPHLCQNRKGGPAPCGGHLSFSWLLSVRCCGCSKHVSAMHGRTGIV